MRITIYTNTQPDWFTAYQIAELKKQFEDVTVVAVDTTSRLYRWERLKSKTQQLGKKGLTWFIKRLLETKQLKACYANWNEAVNHYKKELNFTEPGTLPISYDCTTRTINGEDAVKVIQQTQPDILIQAGAGILQPQIFTIPTRTTLNIHGAIAPKLRGGHSIFWSYYYGKPEWLGVTIHQIDSGIDTGSVYKRATLQYEPGIHPAKKIVECCTLGSVLLIQVIQELAQNAITPTQSNTKGTYKGFYSASQYQVLQSNNWFPVEPNRYPSSI